MSWRDLIRNRYQSESYYDAVYDDDGYVINYVCNTTKFREYCRIRNTNIMLEHPQYPGFRNGPIPGIHHYGHGWWHRYSGNHSNSFLREYKDNNALRYELEDYALANSLIRKKRSSFVKHWAMEWDDIHYRNSKGRGWKRSRKKKQWS